MSSFNQISVIYFYTQVKSEHTSKMYPQSGNNSNAPLDRWNNIQLQHQTLFSNTTTIGFNAPVADANRQDNRQENRQFLTPHTA